VTIRRLLAHCRPIVSHRIVLTTHVASHVGIPRSSGSHCPAFLAETKTRCRLLRRWLQRSWHGSSRGRLALFELRQRPTIRRRSPCSSGRRSCPSENSVTSRRGWPVSHSRQLSNEDLFTRSLPTEPFLSLFHVPGMHCRLT